MPDMQPRASARAIPTARFVDWYIEQSAKWASERSFVDIRLVVQDGQLMVVQETRSFKQDTLPVTGQRRTLTAK